MGYSTVTLPDHDPKDKEKFKTYTCHQRRGYIFKLIMLAGHPRSVPQMPLAKLFGKSQPTIFKDFRAIKKEITKELGTDAEVITSTVYTKVIRDLLKGNNRDKRNAAKTLKEFNEYLFNIGKKKKVPAGLELSADKGLKEIKIVFEAPSNTKKTEGEGEKSGEV